MREPSIHITESKLRELLIQHGIEQSYTMSILKQATKYQLTNRKTLSTNDTTRKIQRKISQATKEDVQLFAQVLLLVRRAKRHRGINIIKEGSRDFLQLKEITRLALDFCNDFGIINKKGGFQEYIQIAVSKMNKFSLNKINSMHQGICDAYEALEEIRAYNQTDIDAAYEEYTSRVLDKIGFTNDYRNQPEKFVYFKRAAEFANKSQVAIKDYIYAQFEGFEYLNSVPDPVQLVGEKAEERLMKFLYKHNIKVNAPGTKKVDWDTIKNIG